MTYPMDSRCPVGFSVILQVEAGLSVPRGDITIGCALARNVGCEHATYIQSRGTDSPVSTKEKAGPACGTGLKEAGS